MIEKELGGNSSPVNLKGIHMMSDVFHRTNGIASIFSQKRKEIYENYLKKDLSKILEVGCGPGVFYKPWKDLNVRWTGIDINPYWKEFGENNKVPISNTPLDAITEKFDVVTAHQVIEHVEDPFTFMKKIKSLVNPGGIIHLELPNQFGLSAKLRKISPKFSHDYGFVQPPMHLRAYSKKTISYLFDSLDLKSEMVFVCGNTDRIWGQVREYSLPQKLYYNFSGKIGMGSLLIGIAKIT
tara:strand:- start:3152 stop:3868 length:717 start_codon:yes stop_codon:yes gene_type:complete